MQNTLYIGLSFLIGILMAINLPMNSSVSRYVGSSITANVTFFIIALFTSIAILVVFGKLDTMKELKTVPVHLFLPGFIAAFIILAIVFLIPHIGARKFFVLSIAGQITMAIVISHFGILECPKDPINIRNIIGASFVLVGVIISTS